MGIFESFSDFEKTIGLLAFLQGIIVGIVLLFNSSKDRPSFWLGSFSIVIALMFIEDLFIDIENPYWLFLPLNFNYLVVPLLFIYIKSVFGNTFFHNEYNHLIPGISEFVIFTVLFLLPTEDKQSLSNNLIIELITLLIDFGGLIYSLIYAIKCIRLINKNAKKALFEYSSLQGKTLKWAKSVAILMIAIQAFLIIGLNIILGLAITLEEAQNSLIDEIITVMDFILISVITFLIYWVGINGLKQQAIRLHPEFSPIQLDNSKEEQTSTMNLKEDTDKKLFNLITDWLESEKAYTNPELNLVMVANQLHVNSKKISKVINQSAQKNFNKFINEYRVTEAQNVLTNPEKNHYSMVGIAYEVGFNSKATFYAAFKEICKMPPNKYKQIHQLKKAS